MSRALVLGGGGPVGIGWQAGLIVGLAEAGVRLSQADAFIGTSAGSVVGSQLASGADLAGAVELLSASVQGADAEIDNQAGIEGLQQLMTTVAEAAAGGGPVEETRARLGRLALQAPTIAEDEYLQLFSVLAGGEWPTGFSCTAVDTGTGQFRVWDSAAGVELHRAVASSCSVPTVYPPVTIGGSRYMDGGMRDMVNADVAAGHDVVVAMSCTLLEIPAGLEGLVDPSMQAVLAGTRAQIDSLRDGGSKVEVIVPGAAFLEVSGWGLNLMDYTRVQAAYDAGVHQAAEEAARLGGVWSA